MGRSVNVTVSDIAALLGKNRFDSKRNAMARIRRRGGIQWRRGTSSLHGRYDEFAVLRPLPAARAFVEKLNSDPKQFADNAHGEDLLASFEDRIRANAMGMCVGTSKKRVSSFVNTELGKAMETEAITQFEFKYGYCLEDRQRRYTRTWTHPKAKSVRVHLVGCVDATIFDSSGNKGVLEIKVRRHGFKTVQRHEKIQLRTYLTLAKRDHGILLQSFAGKLRKTSVKRNDDWFYRCVKPAIDNAALQIARMSGRRQQVQKSSKGKKASQRKRCLSKGNG